MIKLLLLLLISHENKLESNIRESQWTTIL